MESTLQTPALVAAKNTPKAKTIVYRIVTALFCLEMSFTAYYMLMRLPEGARKIFVLHDVEGYKHEEIAEMMGITSGGSKAQLHRARLLLREALER